MKSDYERIAKAISFIVERAESQPTLDEISAHVHLSPFHFQRLFSRWAGVTPKRFLQVLTLERAKRLLAESRSLLDVSEDLGLSSGSRLYDHFVQLEAVTPGEFKSRGGGMTIRHARHDTPFGPAFVAMTPRGICSLEFVDDDAEDHPLDDLTAQWPRADFVEEHDRTGAIIHDLFGDVGHVDRPLSLHVSGTNFQVSVWRALLQVPPGSLTSYSRIAAAVGHPAASRAVGAAVGMNPVAFLIPCHRVIRETGELGGYRWGTMRKRALHCWEAARVDLPASEAAHSIPSY